jgi:PAS domain S-box-containing protein
MEERLEILHLEDNDFDAELIQAQLSAEFPNCRITRVKSKDEYIDMINNGDFHIVLSDNSLPDYDGISALKYTRQLKPNLPFIFLSGTIGEDRAIEALRNGATDYVLKDRMNKLGLVIKRVINEYEKSRVIEHANEKIKKNEERLSYVIQATSDAIWDYDIVHEKIWHSEAIASTFFFKIDEVSESLEWWIERIHPEDRNEFKKSFSEALNSNHEFWSMEYRVIDGKGEDKFISDRAHIIRDEKGNPTRMIGGIRDITERKNAEEQLRKAKENAEEMNRLKTYFLTNMSHELRTPMVAILGFAELLQMDLKDKDHIELVNNILDGGHRLNNTLNSILELSNIEAKNEELVLKASNLADIVNSQIERIKKIAQKKNLFIKAEIPDATLTIKIDQELFIKALYNIIDNGIKFSEKGGVTIQVLKEDIKGTAFAVINVIDTGIGIPKEKSDTIFMEFRQASEGFSRGYEGSGLGLSISKRIIELMGGGLTFQSELGKGSIFTIKFPVFYSDIQIEDQARDLKETFVTPPNVTAETNVPKVLLVEDNHMNSRVNRMYLKDLCNVTEAVDGLSAIALASNMHFDIILMDINLGVGIDGVETMHRIRKTKSYADTPIIAVSAYVMSGDRERFISLGFTDYIPKPYIKESFIKSVHKYF